MNIYSGGYYGYNRGYYSYKAKNKDIKTHYYIEYTRDQKVFDMIDTAEFDFDMLNRKDFDYLEDAVSFWNHLYYDETILHVLLREEIILDGEVILEQCKDMIVPTVLDKISEQYIKQAENRVEIYKNDYERLRKFLETHGINTNKITDEGEYKS